MDRIKDRVVPVDDLQVWGWKIQSVNLLRPVTGSLKD